MPHLRLLTWLFNLSLSIVYDADHGVARFGHVAALQRDDAHGVLEDVPDTGDAGANLAIRDVCVLARLHPRLIEDVARNDDLARLSGVSLLHFITLANVN